MVQTKEGPFMDVPNHVIQAVVSSCGLTLQVKGRPVHSAQVRMDWEKITRRIVFHHRVLGNELLL